MMQKTTSKFKVCIGKLKTINRVSKLTQNNKIMPNSSSITDVRKLAEELHASKLLNLDVTAKQLLGSAQGIGKVGKGGELQNNVLAWDHYVVVTGINFGEDRIRDVSRIKDKVNSSVGQ